MHFKYWFPKSESRWKRDPLSLPPVDTSAYKPGSKLPPLLPPSIVKLLRQQKNREIDS